MCIHVVFLKWEINNIILHAKYLHTEHYLKYKRQVIRSSISSNKEREITELGSDVKLK